MSDPQLCRVVLHRGENQLDLTLPSAVPVASLIPAIIDLLPGPSATGAPHQLHRPGLPALDGGKTLAQHGIADGTLLLLIPSTIESPPPRWVDPAEQVAATICATTRQWTPAASRLTATLAATGFAGLAGFVAVPGGPGAPNALLAAAAAAAATLLAGQLSGGDGAVLTAVGALAALAAAVSLTVELTGITMPTLGVLLATAALGLLRGAARISIAAVGLPRRPGPPPPDLCDQTVRARRLLIGLVVIGSITATLGAAFGAVAAPPFGAVFAAAAGVALLCQVRCHVDPVPMAALLTGGIGTFGVALVGVADSVPHQRFVLTTLAAAVAAGALLAGYTDLRPSPLIQRGAEVLEYVALIALVPLAGWCCGWFAMIRGLSLG